MGIKKFMASSTVTGINRPGSKFIKKRDYFVNLRHLYIIPFLIILSMLPICYAVTPVRVGESGQTEFAVFTVGDTPCFSLAEKNKEVLRNPQGVVTTLVPSFYETAVSTTLGFFENNSDYYFTLTLKPYIVDKILDLTGKLTSFERLLSLYPGLGSRLNPLINRITSQIDILVSLYNSL